MNKRLLCAAVLFLLVVKSQAQCIENGIFTRPDSAINTQRPSMLNNFDWLRQKYKLNTLAATPGNDSMWSPIYQPDNEIVDHIRLALDMKPQDGWELIRREMGYNQDGTPKNPKPENPYIVMYNKYTGVLRLFYARGSSAPFSSARITLKFSDGSPAQTSLLDLSQGLIPMDSLFTKNKIFQSPTKFDNRLHQWFFADFPMQYDPCTCYYTSRLVFKVDLISQANVDISGSANGKLLAIDNNLGQVNQQDKTFTFADLQSGFNKASKIFKDINKFKDDQTKAIDTLLKNNASAANDKKSKLNLFQTALKGSGFLKGGLAAAPYIGAAISLFDFFVGGGKKAEPAAPQDVKLTPTSIDMTIKLNGTITTSNPYGDVLFWNPGSNIGTQSDADYPYYNEIMGIFNLTETPKVDQVFSRERRGSTRDGFYWQTSYGYRINTPIKYALNPAARLALQDAQVALVVEGDSSDLYGPAGGFWIMEGKDQRSGYWQYRSDYVDATCLNREVFEINGSSAPGNINWLPKGRIYLKFLLNFKRLLDTAGAQNVLLAVKYPVKINRVSDLGAYDPMDPCTGTLLIPATNSEINTLCNGTTYKTNRVLRRRPDITVRGTTDGLERAVPQTMLAPNPTSTYSSLLLTITKSVRLNIYLADVTGRRILTISNNKNYPEGITSERIDAQNLPNGIYNVVIENNNNRIVKKLVVQR